MPDELEKEAKLLKRIESLKEIRLGWFEDAIRAEILCDLLPQGIRDMDITGVDYSKHTGLEVTIHAKEGDNTLKTLRMLGIQKLKTKVSSYNQNYFWANGTGKLSNGTLLSIKVSNVDKPEGCRVEEKTEMKTEYVLVCEKSGEQIK